MLIFFIVILKRMSKNRTDSQIEIRNLTFKIEDLKNELDKKFLNFSVKTDQTSNVVSTDPEIVSPTIEIEKVETVKEEKLIEFVEEKIEITQPLKDDSKIEETIQQSAFIVDSNIEPIKEPTSKPIVFEPRKSWFETFKEKNPDLEKFIGENLISKLGILILVLGISFFVKYAIDRDWINETARVGIGILAGGIVMAVAHKLRKNFAAFSSVFVAGAVSIFYFTIGIAFHDYELFSQTVAFTIMVVITIFSALVSVSYNRKELAILTLIGGFAVPFMVSTGSGNYQVLFSYIAILNVGMLIISYFKKWNVVTLLAFIFSTLIYGVWFRNEFILDETPYFGALIFAILMYIIFSIASVINNVRNNGSFTKMEYLIMLANTFSYFGIGATIFSNWQTEFKGIFTISLAIYNLVFSIVLYRKFGIKKDAIYFLLGLALTFITLTIPFQFNGNYITLFWACEAVLLFWLSQKSKITTFRIGSIVVQFLMLVSLLMDWGQNYSVSSDIDLYPFFNKVFITGLFSVASFVMIYSLAKKEIEPTKFYFITIATQPFKQIELVLLLLLGYLVGMLEVFYQVNLYFANEASIVSYTVVYHFVFTTILVYFLFKFKNQTNSYIAIFLSGINLLIYLVKFHRLTYEEIFNNLYFNYESNSAFIGHYVILISVLLTLYLLFKNRKDAEITTVLNNKISIWVFAFILTFILSNEIMVHTLISSADSIKASVLKIDPDSYDVYYLYDEILSNIKKRVIKVGFPILWGLLSFVFLIIGIKKEVKQLRIIALSLLGLTVVKLFVFDINVSGPGRIVAFILLGILILIISFVYQKLNKKSNDENQKNNNEKNS